MNIAMLLLQSACLLIRSLFDRDDADFVAAGYIPTYTPEIPCASA